MHQKKNYLYHRDVFLSLVFTYALIWFLGLVFFNTKFLQPVYHALKDFQFTDMYYSLYVKNLREVSTDVVLVNIGRRDRGGIADLVEVIRHKNPRVIGMDVAFQDLRDPTQDTLLRNALDGESPLVSISQLNPGGDLHLITNEPFFGLSNREGYGNFGKDSMGTVRSFSPFIHMKNGSPVEDTLYAFTSRILYAGEFNEAFEVLRQRNNPAEWIRYSGKVFPSFDPDDMYMENEALQILENKIVLVGYLGPGDGVRDFEDAYLTPLNRSFGGYALPDMYGVQIHAHILDMLLHHRYVFEPPRWSINLIGFFITLVHMYLFLYYFVRRHLWFHFIAKASQLISFGVLFFAAMGAYHYAGIRMEPAFFLIAVVLSVDALYFLDAIMKWLHRKWGFTSYFILQSHSHES